MNFLKGWSMVQGPNTFRFCCRSGGGLRCPSTSSCCLLFLVADQWWLGSVVVRTLDLRPRGRWFDSRSGRYQVVSTWMGDCLRTGKPSRYMTNTKVNSAFHPSGVGKSSAGLYGWGYGGACSPVSGWQVTLCDPIWQVTLRSSEMGFPWRAVPINQP